MENTNQGKTINHLMSFPSLQFSLGFMQMAYIPENATQCT